MFDTEGTRSKFERDTMQWATDGLLALQVDQFSHDFDTACQERHERGAHDHGPITFLSVDTLQEAMDEIVDFANYARYTYIKLRLLQAAVEETLNVEGKSEGFVSVRKATEVKEPKREDRTHPA